MNRVRRRIAISAAVAGDVQLGYRGTTIPVTYGEGPEPQDTGIWLPCGVAMSKFYAAAGS